MTNVVGMSQMCRENQRIHQTSILFFYTSHKYLPIIAAKAATPSIISQEI